MNSDSEVLTAAQIDEINDQASQHLHRGMELMETDQAEAVVEALGCFERALELRLRLPVDSAPPLRHALAACWLNRAEALMRLGGPEAIAAALQSFDAALALQRSLPLAGDPRFRRRLAIAHQNRGLALLAQDPPAAGEAVLALQEAAMVLEDEQAAEIPDRSFLLSAVWVNLANTLMLHTSDEAAVAARDASLRAIALVEQTEASELHSAEVGLKARHTLCRALVVCLSSPAATDETLRDDIHAATDAADDALALARQWEQQGVDRFRGIAVDLFRFGARMYAFYQPQFVQEFVHDNLDPAKSSAAYVGAPEMQAVAAEALQQAGTA